MSLKDLQKHERTAADEGEHSDEGDDPQSFYAGGKHSYCAMSLVGLFLVPRGMMVEGGPRKRGDEGQSVLARQILDLARQNAGQHEEEASGKEDKGKDVFRGSGISHSSY